MVHLRLHGTDYQTSTHCILYAGRDVMQVAREIVATITDPSAMVGPEVWGLTLWCSSVVVYLGCLRDYIFVLKINDLIVQLVRIMALF